MAVLKQKENMHDFHIPVMGTAFSVDAPIKVARYGITSVISIGDDELCEYMRRYHAERVGKEYTPIHRWEEDYRARRLTAYLNLVNEIVKEQWAELVTSPFEPGTEITKYFEMLPDTSSLKVMYREMEETADNKAKKKLQDHLRTLIRLGSIECNIMTKIDRNNYRGKELLPEEYSDALAGLRGYAKSTLEDSSIVFSAGFNRRLYAYIEKWDDFFPDEHGNVRKRVILKVSDHRSSLTQGKFLAKKGVWVYEHRIESGLNCGGHAFATEGELLGPILEEFKNKREELFEGLLAIANEALSKRGRTQYKEIPYTRITVQGGIGTVREQRFLIEYYKVDGTGWATPFLLVPEVTNVDGHTREQLRHATKDDLYLSEVSPLGIPFNTIRATMSEEQKMARILTGKPGSSCPKGHLVTNTEFTEKPICRASSAYQNLKIKQLQGKNLPSEVYSEEYEKIVRKVCLCEDLAAPVLINNSIDTLRPLKSAICPGPNLAHFSRYASLQEMVGHIYGRINLLNDTYRPNMFIKELEMYVDYLVREINESGPVPNPNRIQYLQSYVRNLFKGISYYKTLIPKLHLEVQAYRENMARELLALEERLKFRVEEYHHLWVEERERQFALV